MRRFKPARVYVRDEAWDYPLTHAMVARFEAEGVPVERVKRVRTVPGEDPREQFYEAKRTLVLTVRQRAPFQGCRPSANWQLPLVSGCPGHCHYCYLNTSFGPRPYVRVYVNVDEILGQADAYVQERRPRVTIFEGSATSDPIPLEPWTGSLARAIEHFGAHPFARFRIATKYDGVDPLLGLDHRGHTRIRFTVNSRRVVGSWDKAVAGLSRRIEAARKVARAGYPFGFLIGPIVLYEGWEREYEELVRQIADAFTPEERSRMSLELIAHRYTPKAKELIESVYAGTDLPMSDDERVWRYGQFGYGKWMYPKEAYAEIKRVVQGAIGRMLPQAKVMYLV